MRKKSITAFLCVYAALCISYFVVSSGMAPDDTVVSDQVSTKASQSVQTSVSEPKASAASSAENSSSANEAAADETTVSSSSAGEAAADETTVSSSSANEAAADETTVSSSSAGESSADEASFPEKYAQESSGYASDVFEEAHSGSEQEIIQESGGGEQYEGSIEDEDESIEEKPTLEEFLRGLRCSGCRHNCTLFSPRCMNGARKASQAESQYYQLYN